VAIFDNKLTQIGILGNLSLGRITVKNIEEFKMNTLLCNDLTLGKVKLTSRQRVLNSLNFQPVDRIPKDLGGMNSTGISAFLYPKLTNLLGLGRRAPRIHDTNQMLALPELDVLDLLGCDVIHAGADYNNIFDKKDYWHPYNFNGQLNSFVNKPEKFVINEDGSISQGNTKMVEGSTVFDAEHGGQPISFLNDIPKDDLKKCKEKAQNMKIKDEEIQYIVDHLKRVRETTDKAIFYNGRLNTHLAIGAQQGIGIFPMLCLLEPDYIHEYHSIQADLSIYNLKMLLPEIKPFVDIVMMAADDWGTQQNCIASPETYRILFKPYIKSILNEFHRIAPDVKAFLHSCGAIYDLIEDIIDSGFDVLNPVQWSSGNKTYKEWKDKCRNRISLWGGGVNTQSTLPFGTLNDVRNEVDLVSSYLISDTGFVFCAIHNLLSEVDPEKIIEMYKTVHDKKIF